MGRMEVGMVAGGRGRGESRGGLEEARGGRRIRTRMFKAGRALRSGYGGWMGVLREELVRGMRNGLGAESVRLKRWVYVRVGGVGADGRGDGRGRGRGEGKQGGEMRRGGRGKVRGHEREIG